MSVWDAISKLAHEIFGDDAPRKVNLSSIETRHYPHKAKPEIGKRFSSNKTDLSDIEVLPEYEFILQAIGQGCPAIFVTGEAGTGKSTLVRYISATLNNCVIVAPTAIAAISVGGDTIHSFFGLPPRPVDSSEILEPNSKSRSTIENMRALIIDEISMVTPNLVDCINVILKKVRRTDKPFGGIPVIFVGDMLQLPPVVASQEESIYYSHRYKSQYFFSADIFNSVDIFPVHLNKVRRQADNEFIDALSHIRVKNNHREHVALFNRKCFRDKDRHIENSGMYLVPTNAAAKAINTDQLNSLKTTLSTYLATVTGNIPANKWRTPAPDILELKIGAQVIFLKNKKPVWINGDTGDVVGLADDIIKIKKHITNNIIDVSREVWERIQYVYNYETQKIEKEVVGTFTQFPLALGWAITIHKSQGMTLDNVVIDLGAGAFCEGQTYVALSRCRTMDGITLSRPISMSDVKADQAVIDFLSSLESVAFRRVPNVSDQV
jgi:ATP-dependent exoDNAse (exonuclease V) alpha subunit